MRLAKIGLLVVFVLWDSYAWADVEKTAPSEDITLLEWDGLKISRLDFESELRRIPEDNRYEFLQNPKRIDELLQNLVIHRSIAARARQEGLAQSPINKKEIEIAGERALSAIFLAEFRKKIVLPDFEKTAREYYDFNSKEFAEPEMVHVSHIVLNPKKRGGNEATIKLAQEVKDKAASGVEFAALAEEYSDDPSAKKNKGDLGYFGRGKMIKEFESVAFSLSQPGEMGPIVETKFGFHIIRFHGKRPASIKPYESVKVALIEKMKKGYVSDRVTELLAGIRQNPAIQRNGQAIDALQTPPIMPAR